MGAAAEPKVLPTLAARMTGRKGRRLHAVHQGRRGRRPRQVRRLFMEVAAAHPARPRPGSAAAPRRGRFPAPGRRGPRRHSRAARRVSSAGSPGSCRAASCASRGLAAAGSGASPPCRVARLGKDLPRRAFLDQRAGIEHADACAHAADHRKVVADEQDGAAHLGAQPLDEVEHLGLHRRVQRGCRLVEDEQRRVDGQRHGDDHGAGACRLTSWCG